MWLCARFPLRVLDREPAQDACGPFALTEQQHILEADGAAHASGVRPGQSLATARALCPELDYRPPSPERLQRRLAQFALWAYRFTPEVSLSPPTCLLLQIGGSLKLFGGFAPLSRRFRRGFRARRIQTAYGLGHTPLAAELLSHAQRPLESLLDQQGQLDRQAVIAALDQLPVTALPCNAKTRQQLTTLGLNNMGELRALPAGALNRRFGPDFTQLLDRLYGREPDPRPRFIPPDSFYGERQFNGGLTRSEELRFPMAALLDELGHYLQLKQWRNRHLDWHFHYSDGGSEQLSLPVSQPYFDRRQLLELVLLKLEPFQLRGPVDTLVLHCTAFEALQARSRELFDSSGLADPTSQERYLALLDKLHTRLGADACWQGAIADEPLPEQAGWRDNPLRPAAKPLAAPEALRPLWLLERVLPLTEQQGQPCWQGDLQLLQGPERIDHQWWHQRQVRDYYIARSQAGELCWIYRDCLQQRWYLHGLFG